MVTIDVCLDFEQSEYIFLNAEQHYKLPYKKCKECRKRFYCPQVTKNIQSFGEERAG